MATPDLMSGHYLNYYVKNNAGCMCSYLPRVGVERTMMLSCCLSVSHELYCYWGPGCMQVHGDD